MTPCGRGVFFRKLIPTGKKGEPVGIKKEETMPNVIMRCGSCGKEAYVAVAVCPECGERMFPILKSSPRGKDVSEKNHILAKSASSITLTTAFSVAGREIDHEIEVVTAECAFGMNIFRDFFASVSDTFGGRSGATQKVLRDARRTALAELKREALTVGADAVIGVDLDYSEFSGKMKSMLFLVASGTAVKLKPQE